MPPVPAAAGGWYSLSGVPAALARARALLEQWAVGQHYERLTGDRRALETRQARLRRLSWSPTIG